MDKAKQKAKAIEYLREHINYYDSIYYKDTIEEALDIAQGNER